MVLQRRFDWPDGEVGHAERRWFTDIDFVLEVSADTGGNVASGAQAERFGNQNELLQQLEERAKNTPTIGGPFEPGYSPSRLGELSLRQDESDKF